MTLSKRNIIYICASVLLTAYLVFAVVTSRMAHSADHYTDLRITVHDTAGTGFVTATDVDRMLGTLSRTVRERTIGEIDTRRLLLTLREQPTVESASVVALNSGVLAVDVTPMIPVVRVFDGRASRYYNAAGKNVPSGAGHYVDVPVVYGNISDSTQVTRLLPMLDYIRRTPAYDALVTSLYVDDSGDIIVIPTVTGHVINLGDTTDVPGKLERVTAFYHRVMPVKGWEYYDTISVKWAGRVVATRKTKKKEHHIPFSQLEGMTEEVEDEGTMSPDQEVQQEVLRARFLQQ